MKGPKIAKGLEQLWEKSLLVLQRLDDRAHGWLGIIAGAGRLTLMADSAITAAAIAYFALFSLFPLILLSIFIASFKLIPLLNQQFILSRIEFIAPALGELLGANIDHIIRTRGPVSAIALVSLIWSASSVFNMLNQTMYNIWGRRGSHPISEQRGLATGFVLAFAGPVLILISIATSIVSSIPIMLPAEVKPLVNILSVLLSILLDIVLFFLLYILFPVGKYGWREILPGAIGAGLLWELAKLAFLAFVSGYVSASNLVYGSIGAVIAFLTWAFLSGLILLFGAYLSFNYVSHMRQQQEKASAGISKEPHS